MTIRRAFVDLPDGQIHYRIAGKDSLPALLLVHASPGSSRQLVSMIEAVKDRYRVIAPDTAGNGDSTPLAEPVPTISDYAARLQLFLDALGVNRLAVWGSHTGAAIAAELAITAPERVSRLLVNGIGLFTDVERASHLAHYAHPFPPDVDGAYLMRAFHFCRDQYLFFPWYDRTRDARRDGGLRPAEDLHAWFVEVLKAAETYHLAYRASFRWDGHARLPLVRRPTLLMAAADDPLIEGTRAAATLVPDGVFATLPRHDDPAYRSRSIELLNDFLREGEMSTVA